MVAVVGVPDAQRTEIVAAVIVLHDGHSPSDDLKHEIQEHVKSRLAAHEYPREVFFVQELPMTTTGKVIRRELRDSVGRRSEEHTSELQSLMRISYAVFCLKKIINLLI